MKLFGNAAFQVWWDETHTKVIKFYHIPVQTLRAEKLYNEPQIQNYYYCTDWNDQRKIKDKKLKMMSVYGNGFSGSFGRQNVTITIQGDIKLVKSQ